MLRNLPDTVQDLWAGLFWTTSGVLVVEGFTRVAGFAVLGLAMAWLLRTGLRIARDAAGAAQELQAVMGDGAAVAEAQRVGVAVALGGLAGTVAAATQVVAAAI